MTPPADPPRHPPSRSGVPERIGKYTIVDVLGRGAMGLVYKAYDPHIQRTVAIKVIHKELLGDGAAQETAARFRNEAQAVGRIQHPGIVAIYEFGEDEDTAYIAMEFVEGQNLDQILKANPRLPPGQVRQIMDQLLDALHCAHQAGVWHRDIKPANLIMSNKGQLKLTDFGIARIENLELTQVASSIGTPGFMAPEQYIGEVVDHRADIFASGSLYYRLLSGVPAFSGSPESVMYRIFNEQPTPLATLLPGVYPEQMDALITHALAKKREDRIPSAQAFKQAIADLERAHGTLMGSAQGPADEATTVILPAARRPAPLGVPVATELAPTTQLSWQATVVTPAAAPPSAPLSPAAAAPPAYASGTGVVTPTTYNSGVSGSAPVAGWDMAVLARVERSLASHVGPMARILVRNTARGCGDLATLAQALSAHIEALDARAQFMREMGTASTSGISSAVSQATLLTTVPGVAALSDELKQQSQKILAQVLGPIAKVIVRSAADKAVDRAHFERLLLDAVDLDERQAVQQQLQRLK